MASLFERLNAQHSLAAKMKAEVERMSAQIDLEKKMIAAHQAVNSSRLREAVSELERRKIQAQINSQRNANPYGAVSPVVAAGGARQVPIGGGPVAMSDQEGLKAVLGCLETAEVLVRNLQLSEDYDSSRTSLDSAYLERVRGGIQLLNEMMESGRWT